MATPVIRSGYRGLEDRGKPGNDGNPKDVQELIHQKPHASEAATAKSHITLQASKQGRIVQLTAPADRVEPATGTRIKARPLVLNFAAGSGFVRLDLNKEEDRRKWLRVAGSERAEADFADLGLTHKPHPEDGTDPIPKHPRFALGQQNGFWNVAESQARAIVLRRTAVLDQIATDPRMEEFLSSVSPKELADILAKRREAQKNQVEGRPAPVADEVDLPRAVAKPTAKPGPESEPGSEPEPDPEPEIVAKPARNRARSKK